MIPDTSHLFRQPKLAFCLKKERGKRRDRAEQTWGKRDGGAGEGDERKEPGKEVSPADGCWGGTVEGEERGVRRRRRGEEGCNWIKRGGRGVNRQNQDKEK